MSRIVNGSNINYTEGDVFPIDFFYSIPLEEGSELRFQIGKNNKPLFTETVPMVNGGFRVVLNSSNMNTIAIDDNLEYRVTILGVDGSILTEKSGNFRKQWGA